MVPPIQDFENKLANSFEILEKCTPATLPVEYIDVKFHEDEFKDDSLHEQLKCGDLSFPFNATPVVTAPLAGARNLYDGRASSKKIIELTVDIGNIDDYTFSPGDSIGVLVSNSRKDVDRVLLSMELTNKADSLCEVFIKARTTKKNAKIPQHIPQKTSARAILQDCLDLRSVPKKLLLRSLAEYTREEGDKKFLISVSSKEGSKLYNELILEKTRTFLEILDLCPSCCPPLSLLIEQLPRLKPRPYSIINSPLTNSGKIQIILSVFLENPGVATGYLTSLAEEFLENPKSPPSISFYFRETNKFSFTIEESKVDNILIGIGCGVAPFLGFLEHKDCLTKQNSAELGSTWLFVGSTCQGNAVHRERLLDYKERGILQELYESFSRDPECASFKYVQDQIKSNATKFVNQFGKKETILYVCADGAKISKCIESCIKESIVEALQCSKEEADKIIRDSRISGKYREDVWV